MPFFGVPIRNGLPIGLGSVAGFGVQQFDPSQLFEGGTVAGAWYDPSDLSTMFTTSAGTTPVAMPGGGAAVSVGRMLDKSGNGNHAIAFNDTTARPELRARVNLLTYSEEFDNGAWVKNNVTITANAAVAPNGTTTADLLTVNDTSNPFVYLDIGSFSPDVFYKGSISIKAGNTSISVLQLFRNGAGIVAPTNASIVSGPGTITIGADTITVSGLSTTEWTRVSIVGAPSAGGTLAFYIKPRLSGSTIGDTIYIWGADLRPANIGANVPAYQRIADANTYDTSGFPLYLLFDGIDDSMYTPANLNLSGTDKVSVFAGVRKLSDAAQGVVVELSATIASNNGTFLLAAPDGATQTYGWDSKGTAQVDAVASSLAAPITNVLAGTADIAGDSCIIRVNGAVADTETGDQGTGNYGTYPLFIGARNNGSSWFNGHLYSLAVVGNAASAGNIAAMESWVAGRAGIAI